MQGSAIHNSKANDLSHSVSRKARRECSPRNSCTQLLRSVTVFAVHDGLITCAKHANSRNTLYCWHCELPSPPMTAAHCVGKLLHCDGSSHVCQHRRGLECHSDTRPAGSGCRACHNAVCNKLAAFLDQTELGGGASNSQGSCRVCRDLLCRQDGINCC